MDQILKNDIAHYLYQAEQEVKAVEKASSHFGIDIEEAEAYQIQDLLIQQMQADGRQPYAPKLGLTSPAKIDQMQVDSPIYGFIFDSMLYENGKTVDMSGFIHPKVEPEIAIVLKQAITPEAGDLDREGLAEYVDYIVSAVDIIDSRYIDYQFTLGDVIADNASSKGAVFSQEKIPLADLDLQAETAQIKINDQVLAEGSGKNVYRHPLDALLFLVEAFQKEGRSLEAGIPIMTGGMTQSFAVEPGDQVEVTYDHLGKISFELV